MRKGERLLCTICRNQLPLTEYNFIDENPIDRIFYGRVKIKKANSFLFFVKNGIVKNLIHHLKYKNQQAIGTFLGDWFGQLLKDQQVDFIDVIIPVPLHKKKFRKRGYNQLTFFGERLGIHLGAEFLPNILIKTANSKTQTKKSRIYRWQNNKALFTLSDTELLKNKNVLLIDDIVTTGATLEACAGTLNEIEGITLYIATMAVVS